MPHERQIPIEIRNARDFYEWLLAPITTQIALLRNEQADFRRQLFHRLRIMETEMSADTDRIEAALTGLTDPIVAVEAVVTKLVELVRTGNSDPAAVERVLATIEAAKSRIAAAAMAGTPADPNAPQP